MNARQSPMLDALKGSVGLLAVLAGLSAMVRAAAGPGLWSLKPITSPVVPGTRDSQRGFNPIDGFVLAQLQANHLHPSKAADRRTLIRRVTFDLTGLPPTPEDVERFVRDPDARAYERLVDRLLASPRYGERWARHWLDVVRFADSNGFEMNQPRPRAWPYRDYVIASFNADKPYAQFVREQLAGDATGADVATGFLVAGPYDQVKSPDPALTAQQRADELHDMVSTTGATFLGLTVGCARCHDHKFDPITQTDYYRMTAIFAGVQHGERTLADEGTARRVARLEQTRLSLDAKLAALDPLAKASTPDPGVARRAPVNAVRNLEHFTPRPARFVRLTITETDGGVEPCVDELEVFALGDDEHDVALAEAGSRATASGVLAGYAIHRIEHLNDARFGNGHSWISNRAGSGWVQIELKQPATIDRVVWGRDREGKFADRLATRYTIETALEQGQWSVAASSADRAPYGTEPSQLELVRDEAAKLLEEDRQLAREQGALGESQVVYAGTFVQPVPTHKLFRGDAMQPREVVAPGVIARVEPRVDLAVNAPEQQRRLALADWITSPGNPLTARVVVNRLWQYHFGRGIVQTPSDFGRMGTPPTHPQLLDWLAGELIRQGWRLKPIQRLIVLSATYRQSSAPDRGAVQTDGDDTLLWRFAPRRLEAEEIHDAILSVSGKLDLTSGGAGYDPFKPNDNYVRVYTPRDDFGPEQWRRMIFQFKPRLQQDGVFGAFDCPDGGQVVPRRSTSTTPLQALNLMNSSFVVQQAGFFASRVERECVANPEAQVERAFRLAFGRGPAPEELAASLELVRGHGLKTLCRTLLNANEFLYVF